MASKSDDKGTAPEAQLKAWVDRLDASTQKLLRAVRTAVRKRFPTANELAYDYGDALVIAYAPGDHGIDAIFAIRGSAEGVFLYFSQGPQLPDPQRLLRGTGKQVRFMALETASQLQHPDVEALIAATLEQARIPFPAEGKGSLTIKVSAAKKRSGK